MKTLRGARYLIPAALCAGALLFAPATSEAELTYESFGQAFFTQNCTSCHHSQQKGAARYGAPRGVNFDSLALIRQQEPLIRAMATGPEPQMPPAGVVWWWDRERLQTWLDAGLPGSEDSLTPVDDYRNEASIAHQSVRFELYKPWNGADNERVLRTDPLTSRDDRVPRLRVTVTRETDGSIRMRSREWLDARRVTYTPPIPILLDSMEESAAWSAAVTARYERRVSGQWREDGVAVEQWEVKNRGYEVIDNGVVYPLEAWRVDQTNAYEAARYSWWYVQGIGLVRRETVRPSNDYDYEIVRELFVNNPDDPLDAPAVIASASQEWLPFRGRWSSTSYSYAFEQQEVGVLYAAFEPSPTPTSAPLPGYSTPTPVVPSPTATPVAPGLPSPQPTWTPTADPTATPSATSTPPPTETPAPSATPTSTATPTPSATPTPTLTHTPTATPTPEPLEASDPRAADLNRDNKVDATDLMLLLQHWHGAPE